MKHSKRIATWAATLVGAFCVSMAYATPSNIYVFGDSLSDNGNAKVFSGQGDNPNNSGRASNGLVAVEYLALGLGQQLTPSLFLLGAEQGNNYAVGGAKAVDADGDESTLDTNLPSQVNTFLTYNGGTADSDALFVVIIGGNDLFKAQDIRQAAVFAQTPEESKAIREQARAYVSLAVDSTIAQVEKLLAAGATNVMVANTPDIGSVPLTDIKVDQLLATSTSNKETRKSENMYKVSTRLSTLFNRKLSRKIGRLERQYDVDILEYDLFNFLATQISDADDFGNTNVEDGCVSPVTGINPECDFPVATGFVFWDVVHPTTQLHERAANEMLELVAQ